jgi:hypothetical protein
MAGSNGVIVNKQTGKLLHLGSAFPVERDLELYDRGYQFESYDLIILEIRDRKQTLHALGKLHLDVVEPTTEQGVVRQVPRTMTNAELSAKLDQLPCVLSAVGLYDVRHGEPPGGASPPGRAAQEAGAHGDVLAVQAREPSRRRARRSA